MSGLGEVLAQPVIGKTGIAVSSGGILPGDDDRHGGLGSGGKFVERGCALRRELRSVFVVRFRKHELDSAPASNCDICDQLIGTISHARQQHHRCWRATLEQVIDDVCDHASSFVVAARIQISVACHGDPQ